ncbi:MAG TPA: HAD-IC family P-type ATPase, partial [Rhodopila sp.]|nr:HAD-IC family P-type ATPase [Rhodopila sp.]
AALLAGSEHPLAEAVRQAATGLVLPAVSGFRAIPGMGCAGSIEGRSLVLGNARLMAEHRIPVPPAAQSEQTLSYLGQTGPAPALLATLGFTDTIKPGAARAIGRLHAMGLRTVMLTGDAEPAARAVARQVGIKEVQAGILPAAKAEAVARLRQQGAVTMVGDGINDAPALAAADIGIAMGTGTDVAMQTAGITLMRGDLDLVADAIDISRRTVGKIRQGLFWAFAYNVLGIPLAALGYLSPLVAGAAMALSSVSVVSNALLLLRRRPFTLS